MIQFAPSLINPITVAGRTVPSARRSASGTLTDGGFDGESGLRTLRKLSRSYLAASKDLTRVMNRLKAIYRS